MPIIKLRERTGEGIIDRQADRQTDRLGPTKQVSRLPRMAMSKS
jgi:hypothetical protein